MSGIARMPAHESPHAGCRERPAARRAAILQPIRGIWREERGCEPLHISQQKGPYIPHHACMHAVTGLVSAAHAVRRRLPNTVTPHKAHRIPHIPPPPSSQDTHIPQAPRRCIRRLTCSAAYLLGCLLARLLHILARHIVRSSPNSVRELLKGLLLLRASIISRIHLGINLDLGVGWDQLIRNVHTLNHLPRAIRVRSQVRQGVRSAGVVTSKVGSGAPQGPSQ